MDFSNETYTITLLRNLFAWTPPLVPSSLVEDIEQARGESFSDHHEAEERFLPLGKKLWPYRDAFSHFHNRWEGKIGRKFFFLRLPVEVRPRFEAFEACGGTMDTLFRGQAMSTFSSSERESLRDALIAARREMRAFVEQSVVSVEQGAYEAEIQKRLDLLSRLHGYLEELRALAEKVETLQGEIHAFIQTCEHGWCHLGPLVRSDVIERAREHFQGRMVEKMMMV